MTTEYNVIRGYDLNAFVEEVNLAINHGWTLQGGISVTLDDEILVYCQAVIKTSP